MNQVDVYLTVELTNRPDKVSHVRHPLDDLMKAFHARVYDPCTLVFTMETSLDDVSEDMVCRYVQRVLETPQLLRHLNSTIVHVDKMEGWFDVVVADAKSDKQWGKEPKHAA